MFRPMRRHRQQLSQGDCAAILSRGTSGVLAVAGDGGYPYAVPLSYVYQEGTLFFHCAKAGHKLDALRRCNKASFCVIDQDQVVPPEYTTYFRSVIAFGRTRILEDEAEKQAAIWLLAEKYCPGDSPEHRQEAIRREAGGLCLPMRAPPTAGRPPYLMGAYFATMTRIRPPSFSERSYQADSS